MNTLKQFYAKWIKPWIKALASAVGGAVAGLLINWVKGTTPIPTNRQELLTVVVSALLPAIVTVFAPANTITQKQIDKDPNVIGTVYPAPVSQASVDRYTPPPAVTYQTNTGETRKLPSPSGYDAGDDVVSDDTGKPDWL